MSDDDDRDDGYAGDEYDDPAARSARCALPVSPPREFGPDVDTRRSRAIVVSDRKWVNGTNLRYHFLSDAPVAADVDVVRAAFRQWQELPIGLTFTEVSDPDESEIRITFDRSEGSSWSQLGRDCLNTPTNRATMNFGWQLSGWSYGRDTALHEIGHAMGLPHEHQNPKSGIVWDEPKVLAYFAGPPNNWAPAVTQWNVLRKIDPDEVQGSSWDPDSIMHYGFERGLILDPERYRTEPLRPAPNLSERDIEWVKQFYPPEPDSGLVELTPFQSRSFRIGAGEQVDFLVRPPSSREYEFSTFGRSDTVMVLFEDVTTGPPELQGPRFLAGDDDSGSWLNARFSVRLFAERTYRLRVRLYWAGGTGETAVMMW